MFQALFNGIALASQPGATSGATKSSETRGHEFSSWECVQLPKGRHNTADSDGFILLEASRDSAWERNTDVQVVASKTSTADIAKSPTLGFEVVDADVVWDYSCVAPPESPLSGPKHTFDLFEHEEQQSPVLSGWITLGPNANSSTELFHMESDDDVCVHSSTEQFQMDAEDDIWSDSEDEVGKAEGVPFLKLSRRTLASPEANPELSTPLTIAPSNLLLTALESIRRD